MGFSQGQQGTVIGPQNYNTIFKYTYACEYNNQIENEQKIKNKWKLRWLHGFQQLC